MCSEEASKTLQAPLLTPTTWKEQCLQQTLSEYTDALHDAFTAGADTQTSVNDIVTPYELSSYAKDALKSYVPDLLDDDTYGANDLKEEHPIRFTNRAAQFDFNPARTHSFVWKVPQARSKGGSFWIPLQINPQQEQEWHALLDEESDVSAGELRLVRDGSRWVLHQTITYPVEDTSNVNPGECTKVGFDIGEVQLLVGCALQQRDDADDTPASPLFVDGKRARRLRKEMHTTLKRLQKRDAAQWRINERFEYYSNALEDIVEKATRQAVDYAAQFQDPMIVLEDLTNLREDLDYGEWMNRRLHNWAFSLLITRIEQKAREEGIPVRLVEPAYTSQICHACKHVGSRTEQAEFKCTNDACHISTFQADLNGAANVAWRVDAWGESLAWKSGGDDTPCDGSPGGRAATQLQDRATNGLDSSTSVRSGGVDNADASTASAGQTQMTLQRFGVETSADD